MKKKLILILSILLLMISTGVYTYLNASRFNQTDFKVNYMNIDSLEVPEDFDGFTVIFISDIEYGTFFDEKRLELLQRKLNYLNADAVIFGGDLFDKDYSPLSNDVTILTDFLSSITANYGKFAILGDFDMISEQRQALVNKILYDSDFEMLNNNSMQLHKDGSEYIHLLGIDYDEETYDLSSLFSSTKPEDYTITVIHGAAKANAMPAGFSDLTISGHSHHCQINLPLMIDETYSQTGNYAIGKYKTNNTVLYVSHGIGTTGSDYRAFCDPEIVYFTLRKK